MAYRTGSRNSSSPTLNSEEPGKHHRVCPMCQYRGWQRPERCDRPSRCVPAHGRTSITSIPLIPPFRRAGPATPAPSCDRFAWPAPRARPLRPLHPTSAARVGVVGNHKHHRRMPCFRRRRDGALIACCGSCSATVATGSLVRPAYSEFSQGLPLQGADCPPNMVNSSILPRRYSAGSMFPSVLPGRSQPAVETARRVSPTGVLVPSFCAQRFARVGCARGRDPSRRSL
jgi:hypothetical protein